MSTRQRLSQGDEISSGIESSQRDSSRSGKKEGKEHISC